MSSSYSLGSYLADRIGDWLRFSPSREQINSELDQMHHRFGMITSSEFNSCVRKINPESRVHVTCSEHHSIQPISDRGKRCDYDSGRGTCNRKLKITIRSNSMMNIFSRKMKDPDYAKNIGWGPAFKENDAAITSFWGGQFVQDMRKGFPDFFEGDHTPVLFGTFIDGFNPNYYENGTLCSGTIICFNLPPHIRMKEDNLQLNLVIDGPKEPRNFQTYFQEIVKDFTELWETFEVYNAHTNRTEKYKAALVVCIQDGRGMSKTSMMSEAGHRYGCSKCTVIGSYANGKYFYSSRGNLPLDHPMRSDLDFGPKINDLWVHKDHGFVTTRTEEINNPYADQDWIAGIKGKSVLTELPYWDVGKGHLTCFMHTVYNIRKRIEALTLGKYDTVEAREQLKKDCLKSHLHLPDQDVKSYHEWKRTERRMKKRARTQAKAVPNPEVRIADQEENFSPNANQGTPNIPKGSLPSLNAADWRFGYRQIDGCGMLNEKSAMEFLRCIKPPASFCVSLSSFFKDSKERDSEIGKGKGKAEGYRQFMISGVMSASLLVGGVDQGVVQAYDELFDCIKRIGNPIVVKEEFEKLELETIEAVCRIEKEIPRSEAVLSLHQIIHLPRQCLWFGPVRETWAYPLESFLGSLKRMTKNRAHSGASIFSRHMFNTAISIVRGLIKRLCKDNHDMERKHYCSYLRCEGNGTFYSLDIDEMLSIKSYIEREWCTFKHLRREYADPWVAGEDMSCAEKSQYRGQKKKILEGLSPIASSYKKFSIFRTIFGAREGERDNSVVIVGKGDKIDYIARILKIIEVKVTHAAKCIKMFRQ